MFSFRSALLLLGLAVSVSAETVSRAVEVDADGNTKTVKARAHQQLMETEKDLQWKQPVINGEEDRLGAAKRIQRKEASLVQLAAGAKRSDDEDDGDDSDDATPSAADCALDAEDINSVPEDAGKSSECLVVPVNVTYVCTDYPATQFEVDEDLEGTEQAKARCEKGNEGESDYHYHYSSKKDVCGGRFGGCDCCRTWMNDAMQAAVTRQLEYALADHGECHDPPHHATKSKHAKNTKAHCEADLHYDADGNAVTDYQWTWNEGKGTAAAKCGKDADCDCCRRHKHGACVGGATGFPPGSPNNVFETDKEKCEYGNKLGDGFIYTYNEHKGTKTAKCGKDATCDCCRTPETLYDGWSTTNSSNSTSHGGHKHHGGKSKYKKKEKEELYSSYDPRHYLSTSAFLNLLVCCGCCCCAGFCSIAVFMYFQMKKVQKQIDGDQKPEADALLEENAEGAEGEADGEQDGVGEDGNVYTSQEWRDWNAEQEAEGADEGVVTASKKG